MINECQQSRSTNTSGGSWSPEKCLNCGAIESPTGWYYNEYNPKITHQMTKEHIKSSSECINELNKAYIELKTATLDVIKNDTNKLLNFIYTNHIKIINILVLGIIILYQFIVI